MFSSTYRNYKFILDLSSSSASNVSLTARFRSGTTDNTAAQYAATRLIRDYASNTVSGSFVNFNGTSIVFGNISSSERIFMSGEIQSPMIAQFTQVHWNGFLPFDINYQYYYANGILANTTAYDGINFIVSGGTITGKVSIYGFNE